MQIDKSIRTVHLSDPELQQNGSFTFVVQIPDSYGREGSDKGEQSVISAVRVALSRKIGQDVIGPISWSPDNDKGGASAYKFAVKATAENKACISALVRAFYVVGQPVLGKGLDLQACLIDRVAGMQEISYDEVKAATDKAVKQALGIGRDGVAQSA